MDEISDLITMPGQPALTALGEHEPRLPADLDDPQWYLNRELSQLEFFRRVLEEAKDVSHPLLERVKFLAIVGSNLDEFFMVRVAGLKQQIDAGVVELSLDGRTPAEQLAAIHKAVAKLLTEARDCYQDHLLPKLAEAGIHILGYTDLDHRQKAYVAKYFTQVVFPVLTPLAFDPGRPFPHISNLSLNLAVLIRDPAGKERFARVKVPEGLERFVPVGKKLVPIESVIAHFLPMLFTGMEIAEEKLKANAVPVLFVYGELEGKANLALINGAVKALPKAEVVVVEKADHRTTGSRPEFREAVRKFLKASRR